MTSDLGGLKLGGLSAFNIRAEIIIINNLDLACLLFYSN